MRVIIQHDEWVLLLDPWPSGSLAFHGWVSHPQCFLNDKILMSFMNQYANYSKQKIAILISHGHDDHCDDNFLNSISKSMQIFIPEYRKKGFQKRIKSCDFEYISEIPPNKAINFGPFSLSSFIVEEHSEDDAIINIETENYTFVHASDNST